jgi:hypothetical protein
MAAHDSYVTRITRLLMRPPSVGTHEAAGCTTGRLEG